MLRAKLEARVIDGSVGGDLRKSYCICDSGNNLVVAGMDVDEVRTAVVDDVRQGFSLRAVAAYGGGVSPSGFGGVGGKTVQAGLVDEAPVFETYIQTRVVPS